MEPIYVKRYTPQKPSKRKGITISLLVIISFIFSFILGFSHISTPKPLDENTSASIFSAERALTYLEQVAQRPHPLGSADHDRVRDYLVNQLEDMGLHTEIQATTEYQPKFNVAGNVENIIATIEGTDSSGSILVAAHYDSVPGGPGAADDGIGVASILETASILSNGQPLKNDVIFLITDGEENGLLGAQAFVDEHPLAADVEIALNFEARGNSGPSIMFETNEGNNWVVEQFIDAAPNPFAYSLTYDVYKMMPNDTDFSVFKEAGMKGLNFAVGRGLHAYHTEIDNIEALDLGSLQHHGDNMLSLTEHFANIDLQQGNGNNNVYFNVFGFTVASYSDALIVPIMIIVALLFIATVIHGFKRIPFTLLEFIGSIFAVLVSLIIAFGVTTFLWQQSTTILSESAWRITTDASFGNYFLIGMLLITIAILSIYYYLVNKKITSSILVLAGCTLWLVLTVATSFVLPGGSYLFAWPLLVMLICVNIYFRNLTEHWIFAPFAIPALVLFTPIIYLVYLMMTLDMAGAIFILVGLLFIFFLPLLAYLNGKQVSFLITALFFIGIGTMVYGGMKASEFSDHPVINEVLYFQDSDQNKAYWATPYELDTVTNELIESESEYRSITPELPAFNGAFHFSEAAIEPLSAPMMMITDDMQTGNQRTVTFDIKSNRNAEVVILKLISDATIHQTSINNVDFTPNIDLSSAENPMRVMFYTGIEDEFDFSITVNSSDKLEFYVVDQSYSLPVEIARPEGMVTYGDSSYVSKYYEF